MKCIILLIRTSEGGSGKEWGHGGGERDGDTISQTKVNLDSGCCVFQVPTSPAAFIMTRRVPVMRPGDGLTPA